jgi:hypothetical protein
MWLKVLSTSDDLQVPKRFTINLTVSQEEK